MPPMIDNWRWGGGGEMAQPTSSDSGQANTILPAFPPVYLSNTRFLIQCGLFYGNLWTKGDHLMEASFLRTLIPTGSPYPRTVTRIRTHALEDHSSLKRASFHCTTATNGIYTAVDVVERLCGDRSPRNQ